MNDLQKRSLLFLGLCIPSRFLIAFILYNMSEKHLFHIGLALLAMVFSWSYIYILQTRKSGLETLGAPIWWDYMRPVHISFYLMAALMCLRGKNEAYIPVVIDTVMGIAAFIHHHA